MQRPHRDRRARRQRAEAEWEEHARRELFPKVRQSAIFMSLCSSEPDAKFCLELGACLMFDKPLLVIVPPGVTIPDRLRRVAEVVLDDFDINDEASQERLRLALSEVTANL